MYFAFGGLDVFDYETMETVLDYQLIAAWIGQAVLERPDDIKYYLFNKRLKNRFR